MGSIKKDLFDSAYGTIDYLYNEGVMDYNYKNIKAMSSGKKLIDYKDIAKVMLSDFGEHSESGIGELLKRYLSVENENPKVGIFVEHGIKSAINAYSNNMGVNFDDLWEEEDKPVHLSNDDLRNMINETIRRILGKK